MPEGPRKISSLRRRRWRRAFLFLTLPALLGVATMHVLPLAAFHPAMATFAEPTADVILVLGTPARLDGRPSARMAARVDKAVELWRQGAAPAMICTGAAAHNTFVEGEVMAAYARQQGVPAEAALVEGQAHNTAENLIYSVRLMEARGWHRAIIVSTSDHLPRAAYFAARHPIAYRMVGTDAGRGAWWQQAGLYEWETLGQTRLVLLETLGLPPTH